jgi:histidine triad (HIT) family protein
MNPCLFCSIIDKKIPSTIIAENENVIVIKDIAPKAPVHYLVIPKMHVASMKDIPIDSIDIIKQMALMVQELAHDHPQFNLVCNTGADAGQMIMHLHWHFLAGINFFQKYT